MDGEELKNEFQEGTYETDKDFETGGDPSVEARDEIYARAEREREEQIANGGTEDVPFEVAPGVTEEESEGNKETQEETVSVEEAEGGDAEAKLSTNPEPTVIRLKVNGKEVDMPLEEARRILQMTTAAEAARKLQEATKPSQPIQQEAGTAHAEPKLKLPDEIRREMLAIEHKLYFEGAATKEEADALLQRKIDLTLEMEFSIRAAEEMKRRAEEENYNRMVTGQALVNEVAKVHPDFNSVMFQLDEGGRPRINQYGLKDLAPDFAAWLSNQPNSVKFAVLESDDPRDPIAVLNQFKAYKRGGTSLGERKQAIDQKKKTIDPVKGGTGKVASQTPYRELTRSEIIAQMKRERASGSL